MERKPWPIIILGVVHLVEPVAKVIFYSSRLHITLGQMVSGFTLYHYFLFFLSFPLAGIAILSVKRWSYPLFLTIQLVTVIDHVITWQRNPAVMPTVFFVLFNFLNLVVVSYFLIPAVRAAYFDPKLRWWEAKPRYHVSFPVEIRSASGKTSAGTILNLSEGGVFLAIAHALEVEKSVRVEFAYNGDTHVHEGKVLHHTQIGDVQGYGIQFSLDSTEAKRMKKFVALIKSQGFQERTGRVKWTEDFSNWARGLRHGKGLVPEFAPKSSD